MRRYRIDYLCHECGESQRVTGDFRLSSGPTKAGGLGELYPNGNLPPVLIPAAGLPPNTGVTYWMSNNAGARWFIVRPGARFTFPTTGTDLRWRADLHSLSPVRTPRIDRIRINDQHAVYMPLVVRSP